MPQGPSKRAAARMPSVLPPWMSARPARVVTSGAAECEAAADCDAAVERCPPQATGRMATMAARTATEIARRNAIGERECWPAAGGSLAGPEEARLGAPRAVWPATGKVALSPRHPRQPPGCSRRRGSSTLQLQPRAHTMGRQVRVRPTTARRAGSITSGQRIVRGAAVGHRFTPRRSTPAISLAPGVRRYTMASPKAMSSDDGRGPQVGRGARRTPAITQAECALREMEGHEGGLRPCTHTWRAHRPYPDEHEEMGKKIPVGLTPPLNVGEPQLLRTTA